MFFKALIKMIKISGLNMGCLWRNLYYNFLCKSVVRERGTYMFIYPGVILSVDKKSEIELHGNLYLGIPSIKGGGQISKFLMRPRAKMAVNRVCEILDSFDMQIHTSGKFVVDDFHSNVNLEVSCGNTIELKGEVMAGRHVRLKDYNGHEVSYEGYPFSAPILVENHVWICTGAKLNPGVSIGEGAVIGDNSNVVADVPSASFVQGNPARVVSSNIKWSR